MNGVPAHTQQEKQLKASKAVCCPDSGWPAPQVAWPKRVAGFVLETIRSACPPHGPGAIGACHHPSAHMGPEELLYSRRAVAPALGPAELLVWRSKSGWWVPCQVPCSKCNRDLVQQMNKLLIGITYVGTAGMNLVSQDPRAGCCHAPSATFPVGVEPHRFRFNPHNWRWEWELSQCHVQCWGLWWSSLGSLFATGGTGGPGRLSAVLCWPVGGVMWSTRKHFSYSSNIVYVGLCGAGSGASAPTSCSRILSW